MSWDEIKKAREIWPPNIDEILDHFEKAEKLDPNYYQVYKDRARLFYVLKRYGKSNEDYERWRSLGEKWDEDIKNDLLFHKQSGHKGIYPWNDLQKYFDGDTKVGTSKKNQKNKSVKNNKRKNTVKIKKKITDYEFTKQFEYEKYNNVSDTYKENEGNKEFFQGIKDKKNEENEIHTECELLVKNYKRRRGLEDIIFDDFIDVFEYCKKEYPNPINSLKSLINKTDFEIRESFRNLLRVPDKLREFVNDGKLSFDPILSKEIAIHATDVFQWDGQKELEDKVFQLAVSMSKCFSDPNNLDMKKEFFTNPVDEITPISGPSKTAQLNALKEKHPVAPSSFDRYRDRTKFDYWKLVSIKNLKIAEFVLKWEHNHRQRISKKWAYELIQNPEKFFSEHKSEL